MSLDAILHRRPQSSWKTFVGNPWPALAKLLYSKRNNASTSISDSTDYITVVCISDIHNTQPHLPDGDILLVAGDLTEHGTISELTNQLDWISEQSHRHKIVVAGNHDICLDARKSALMSMPHFPGHEWRWDNVTYLEDSSIVLDFPDGRKLKVYGSPWTKQYGNWAFQYEKGQGKEHFSASVDEDTDILVTHSPPRFHLDQEDGEEALLEELWRVRPKLHYFGHMHEGYGKDVLVYDRLQHFYERVGRGKAGFCTVVGMALLLLWQYIVPLKGGRRCTTLVNAAVVGGRSNKERRSIQVVHL